MAQWRKALRAQACHDESRGIKRSLAQASVEFRDQPYGPGHRDTTWESQDNDPCFAGQSAAYALAKRFGSDGRAVEVQIPADVGADWNDVHQLQLTQADALSRATAMSRLGQVGANHG